jgi:excisionase family DNA binding protein
VGISPHVVRQLLAEGELHGVKIRHEWRIFRVDLVEYLERVSNAGGGTNGH